MGRKPGRVGPGAYSVVCEESRPRRRPRQAQKDPGRPTRSCKSGRLFIRYTMDPLLEFAVELAFESGRIQKKHYRESHSIFHKGEINIVTDVDLECQERIMSLIAARFPDDHIIAEEKDNVFEGRKNRWIIDPIDGTTNYAHGYPFFCTSVAYEVAGRVVCGV